MYNNLFEHHRKILETNKLKLMTYVHQNITDITDSTETTDTIELIRWDTDIGLTCRHCSMTQRMGITQAVSTFHSSLSVLKLIILKINHLITLCMYVDASYTEEENLRTIPNFWQI